MLRRLSLIFILFLFAFQMTKAQVTASFSFVDSVCGNLTVSFRNKSSNAGTFFWYFNPGTSGQPNPTFTFPAFGNYDVTLIAFGASTSDTVTKTIHLFPKPLMVLQGPSATLCAGDTGVIRTNDNSRYQYQWSPRNLCTAPDAAVSRVFPLLTTRFSLLVTDTLTRCADTSGILVGVKSCKPPRAEVVFLKPSCGNYTAGFVNKSSNHFASNWNWGDGSSMDNDNSDTLYHTFPGPGKYFVQIMVWDTFGIYFDSLTIKIEIGDVVNAIATASKSQICSGDSVNLRASGGSVPVRWFPFNGLSDSVGNNIYAKPMFDMVYFAVAEDHGCFDTALVSVKVTQFPYTKIYTDSPCLGQPLSAWIHSGSANSGATFSWYWPGTDTLKGSKVSFIPTDTGYMVGGMKMSFLGCDTTLKFISRVFPKPEAAFDRNPTDVFIIRPEVQFYNRSRYATRYRWDFGDGTYIYDTTLSHTYLDTGTFTVKLIAFNENGCTDTISQTFTIRPELLVFIPDAFTPNKNGPSANETFSIFINQWLPEFEFTIWNKWGEKVFETTNQKFSWDGTFNEKPCPDNMYIWRMRYRVSDEKVQNEKGVLFLFR